MAHVDFRKGAAHASDAARRIVARIAQHRPLAAGIIAFCAGVAALIAPPLALLALTLLAARALLGVTPLRVDPLTLAGPAFAALIVYAFVGLPGAVGIVFAWRLIADTRWSVEQARRLAIASGRPGEASFKTLAHTWATPLFGLSIVAYTAPHLVMGLPLDLPHVPFIVPATLGAAAFALFFDWALRRAADWRLGELAKAPAMHLLAHHAVFLIAYGLTLDLSAGVVALCAWRLAHAAPLAFAPAPRLLTAR